MKTDSTCLFRYTEDRLPVALIASLFFLDLAAYAFLQNHIAVLAWALLGLGPKACICSWNHHHQHVSTFRGTWLNRALEVVYALHTGITTNAWVLHHNLGHHVNYLNQDKDESGWKDSQGRTMSAFKYTCVIALTGYLRAYRVGHRHRKYQRTFVSAGTFVAVLLALLLYYKPFNATAIFLVPLSCGYIITCWHTYYHHAGLDSDNHFEASHNIMHSWYNLFTGNLGYHTAHHMKPGLHWSQLPQFHRSIEHKIPARLFKAPCIPFCWIPDRKRPVDKAALAA
ncbi:MAG: fatty acid desaturase [Deltaproteobacteria bacterium]|nr:fatty acid desaturase [Deltaproteobacteria bacterium]